MSAIDIMCNVCNDHPLVGWGYKCIRCESNKIDYYLCELCFPSKSHSHDTFKVVTRTKKSADTYKKTPLRRTSKIMRALTPNRK